MIRLLCLCLALPQIAGAEAQKAFSDCIAKEQARFENSLETTDSTVDALGISGVDFCGAVGIAACDRSGKPIGCQVRLAKAQDAMRVAVLDALPAPTSDALYNRLHGLAHGVSAGPDCSGATAPMVAWCMAWEANAALRSAILAWQWARAEGLVQDAVTSGWASAAEPTPPQGRPQIGDDQ